MVSSSSISWAALLALPLALAGSCNPEPDADTGVDESGEASGSDVTSGQTPTETTGETATETTGETATETTGETATETTDETETETTDETETETSDTTESESTTTESESTTTESESTTTEGESTTTGGLDCLPDDMFEDNDAELDAPEVPWDDNSWFWVRSQLDATLCEDEDWYYFNLDLNMLEGDPSNFVLSLDIIVEGSSWCGMLCEGAELPVAEANTISAEIYSAANMQLLVAQTSEQGRINIGKWGAIYGENMLVRVYGPAEVNFNYYMNFNVRFDNVEDECEC